MNGFAGDGVRITGGGADRNAVHACYVGTNAVGDGAVANTTGIALSAGADGAIGTSAAADRNLVSGNSGEGILVTGSVRDLTILGNFVGVGRTGAETTLGNGGDGIRVASTENPSTVVIGGTGAGNVIARNACDYCIRGYSHGVYNRGQDSAGILMFEQCSRNVIADNSVTHGGDGIFGFAEQQ